MGTHPIFESDFDCLTEKMTESEMKSLLSFGSCSGKSYGTVDRRYLGSNLVSTHFIQYTVKPDDTLTSIAVQYSTTVHQLKRTNKMFLTSNEVEPGRILKIPISNGDGSLTPTEISPRIPTPDTKPSQSKTNVEK